LTERTSAGDGPAEARLIRSRIEKAARLRARGVDPYPARFKPTTSSAQARERLERLEARTDGEARTRAVTIAGRITALRTMGKAAFADIQDAAGKIQAHLRADRLGDDFELLGDLDIGDIVGARGPVFRTRRGEPTVEARSLTILCKSVRGLPDKWGGLQDVEKRFRQRYLDLIARPRTVELLRLRSAVVSSIRRYLEGRGFVEVETPIMVSVAGGAAARPFSTHHNALDRTLYLRIATELHLKRLVVGGIDRVFEIGRIFRNEGIDADHNPEFTMLESYQAYADYNDVMAMVESMVSTVATEVTGSTVVANPEGEKVDLAPPWPRLDLREQVLEHTGIDFTEVRDEESLAQAMAERGIHVEQGLSWARLLDKVISSGVEPHLVQPAFLVDYPVEMSPLAKRKPGADGIVERFEAFARGTELCNAFTELNDPVEQRARFEEQERIRQEYGDEEIDRLDEDFLVAMEHGMPPTGGLGMGVDRLTALLSGERTIREVVLFPQLRSS
jgi:lysyl-tRNA synthetase class 2